MDAIEREKRVVEFMIRFYCRKKHNKETLCENCSDLINYAKLKLDACRYGIEKSSCKKCKTHCYSKVNRDEIRKIMRYAGPRMIYLMPFEILRHKGYFR